VSLVDEQYMSRGSTFHLAMHSDEECI
jgi:hypothetical protein